MITCSWTLSCCSSGPGLFWHWKWMVLALLSQKWCLITVCIYYQLHEQSGHVVLCNASSWYWFINVKHIPSYEVVICILSTISVLLLKLTWESQKDLLIRWYYTRNFNLLLFKSSQQTHTMGVTSSQLIERIHLTLSFWVIFSLMILDGSNHKVPSHPNEPEGCLASFILHFTVKAFCQKLPVSQVNSTYVNCSNTPTGSLTLTPQTQTGSVCSQAHPHVQQGQNLLGPACAKRQHQEELTWVSSFQ